MIQQKIKMFSLCLLHQTRPVLRRICYVGSVALLLALSKVAIADEVAENLYGFKLGGYSSASVSAPRNGSAEASLDDISLMLSWNNNGRLSFFSELELERPLSWNEDKNFNSKNSYFDLERLYLDYNVSEKINLRSGRFLTPAGRWNLLHAAPLVWTATRPLVTSQLFPSAINGLMLFGAVPYQSAYQDSAQNLAFEYSFFIEALKDQTQDNNETMYKNVAGAHFALASTINVGLSLATFTEDTPTSPDYRMIGIDFITHVKGWEISGEGFQRFTNHGSNGGSGAYLQSAVPLGSNWYWLTRLETLQHDHKASARASGDASGNRWVLGLTKRITPKQVLKMELVGGNDDFTDTPRGFVGSFAVLF